MSTRTSGAKALGPSAQSSLLPAPGPAGPCGREAKPLQLGPDLAWLERLTGGLVPGGCFLLAGSPGSGKSRLASQIALGLASTGIVSVAALTEESEDRHRQRLIRVTGGAHSVAVIERVRATTGVERLTDLPHFFNFYRREPLNGAKVVIIDSIQGDGIPGGAFTAYHALFDFVRSCREVDVATILIGHVNKRGQIAGPKGLEHAVDAVWRIERAGMGRLFAVTKNRFGPEHPKGIYLETDLSTTALQPSPHASPVTGIARTYLGPDAIVAELQARVSLPAPGSRPAMAAPGLPRRRVEQVVQAVADLPGIEVGALDLSVSAMAPGDAGFKSCMALPLVVVRDPSCDPGRPRLPRRDRLGPGCPSDPRGARQPDRRQRRSRARLPGRPPVLRPRHGGAAGRDGN